MEEFRRVIQFVTAFITLGFLIGILTKARKLSARQRNILIAPTTLLLSVLLFYVLVFANYLNIIDVPFIMGMSAGIHLISVITSVILAVALLKFVE